MYRTERFKFDESRIVVTVDSGGEDEDYEYHTKNGCWMITCRWPETWKCGEQWVFGGCYRKQLNGTYKMKFSWDMFQGRDKPSHKKDLPQYISDACKKLAERMFERRDCCD